MNILCHLSTLSSKKLSAELISMLHWIWVLLPLKCLWSYACRVVRIDEALLLESVSANNSSLFSCPLQNFGLISAATFTTDSIVPFCFYAFFLYYAWAAKSYVQRRSSKLCVRSVFLVPSLAVNLLYRVFYMIPSEIAQNIRTANVLKNASFKKSRMNLQRNYRLSIL